MDEQVERHMLLSNGVKGSEFPNEDDGMTVKAALCGVLFSKAAPVVSHWISDFYRDVHWVDEFIIGADHFWFGFRGTGTSIGRDRDLVAFSNDHLFLVSLTCESHGTWYCTLTDHSPAPEAEYNVSGGR